MFFKPNSQSLDSYSQIREEISRTANSKVLEISPDMNARYFPWVNPIPTANQSADPAKNDPRFMRAASISSEELSMFLTSEGITHVLIAGVERESNRIFFRWGEGPSVNIVLTEPLFQEVAVAYGEYPATLFEVKQSNLSGFCSDCPGVQFEWGGIRESAINTSRYGYVDGPNLVWILGQEQPSLRLNSSVKSGFEYLVTIEIVAAYGDGAPPQIVKFKTDAGVQFESIVGGPGTKVSVKLVIGEELVINPVLPCMIPAVAQLEEGNQDTRQLCFGIASIKVEEIK